MRAIDAALLALLCGCGSSYRPGRFADGSGRFAGAERVVGCLDLAVAPGAEPDAQGAVAELSFGNRCDAAVPVDLGAVRAVARCGDGREVPVAPYDPGGEIRPALLDARRSAREVIEYPLPPGCESELCLDLARVDAGAPSAAPVVVCLRGGA